MRKVLMIFMPISLHICFWHKMKESIQVFLSIIEKMVVVILVKM